MFHFIFGLWLVIASIFHNHPIKHSLVKSAAIVISPSPTPTLTPIPTIIPPDTPMPIPTETNEQYLNDVVTLHTCSGIAFSVRRVNLPQYGHPVDYIPVNDFANSPSCKEQFQTPSQAQYQYAQPTPYVYEIPTPTPTPSGLEGQIRLNPNYAGGYQGYDSNGNHVNLNPDYSGGYRGSDSYGNSIQLRPDYSGGYYMNNGSNIQHCNYNYSNGYNCN